MLIYRILTAIILIPIVLAALFYLPVLPFFTFTALIVLWGAWEWTQLMQIERLSRRILYLILFAGVGLYALYLPVRIIFIVAFIWWLCAIALIFFYPRSRFGFGDSVVIRGLMGFFVLIPCWIAINFIRNQPAGAFTLLFLFILIWGADSCAYFIGRKWGTKKLIPQVSPGKSWQGLWGAMVATFIIACFALWLTRMPFSIWPLAIFLSWVTVIFSIVGDLFESMMKREANLKDSGSLLPGHGGLLDRIDSLTAAAPIFVLGEFLLNAYLR